LSHVPAQETYVGRDVDEEDFALVAQLRDGLGNGDVQLLSRFRVLGSRYGLASIAKLDEPSRRRQAVVPLRNGRRLCYMSLVDSTKARQRTVWLVIVQQSLQGRCVQQVELLELSRRSRVGQPEHCIQYGRSAVSPLVGRSPTFCTLFRKVLDYRATQESAAARNNRLHFQVK
jgi:hypothetical protein